MGAVTEGQRALMGTSCVEEKAQERARPVGERPAHTVRICVFTNSSHGGPCSVDRGRVGSQGFLCMDREEGHTGSFFGREASLSCSIQ